MTLALYKAHLVQRARIAHQFDAVLQLSDKRMMDVQELPGKDNGPWVKGLAKDIYLEQALKAMMEQQ